MKFFVYFLATIASASVLVYSQDTEVSDSYCVLIRAARAHSIAVANVRAMSQDTIPHCACTCPRYGYNKCVDPWPYIAT